MIRKVGCFFRRRLFKVVCLEVITLSSGLIQSDNIVSVLDLLFVFTRDVWSMSLSVLLLSVVYSVEVQLGAGALSDTAIGDISVTDEMLFCL